jgi:hypothetical protein
MEWNAAQKGGMVALSPQELRAAGPKNTHQQISLEPKNPAARSINGNLLVAKQTFPHLLFPPFATVCNGPCLYGLFFVKLLSNNATFVAHLI